MVGLDDCTTCATGRLGDENIRAEELHESDEGKNMDARVSNNSTWRCHHKKAGEGPRDDWWSEAPVDERTRGHMGGNAGQLHGWRDTLRTCGTVANEDALSPARKHSSKPRYSLGSARFQR